MFSMLIMRSVDGDVTARARIRDHALALFADRGPDAVSIRQIAAEAGVSPALVLHHFGSKDGLRQAVDDHVATLFEGLLGESSQAELAEFVKGDGTSLAEVFSTALPAGSPLPAYLRRLLLSGDPAGTQLFHGWFEGTRALLDHMVATGLAGPVTDPDVRSAFALAADLALILLRDPITHALGVDPLTADGMARWSRQVTRIYHHGLWAAGNDGDHDPAPGSDGRN